MSNKVEQVFQNQFGIAPQVVAFAPGRINFIGEHVDYNDGLVLPIALPIGVSIAVGPSKTDGMTCYSTLTKETENRNFGDQAQKLWTDYCLAAWSVLDVPNQGLNIAVDSSLPHGASVSSSAALLVALLRGFREMFDLSLSDKQIARQAQKAENEFVGVNCGLMDQMASSVGLPKQALLFDTQSGETQPVEMIKGSSILTIHSGQTRKLQGNAYNDRRASCERAVSTLGVTSFRDIAFDDLTRIADLDDRAKARHVVSEFDRVQRTVEALQNNDLSGTGSLLFECHQSLSADFDVSTDAMDLMVAHCRKIGASGARMTGAGFGGCIIVLCKTSDAGRLDQQVRAAFPNAYTINQMDF